MMLGVDGRCGPMNGMLRCFVAKHCEDTQDCSVGFECLSPSEIKERKAAILAQMVKRIQMMRRRNSKMLNGKNRAGISRLMRRRGGLGGGIINLIIKMRILVLKCVIENKVCAISLSYRVPK